MLPDINRATGFVSEGFLGEEWEIRCWLHNTPRALRGLGRFHFTQAL